MRRPNKLDWIVYSIFRWWWNPIFRKDPTLTYESIEKAKAWMDGYEQLVDILDEKGR